MSGAEPPLVSVVVPVFNGARYLRSSLDTILAQTYPRVEVLVMDDASTDETPAILASYGDRLRHIRQPENRGIYGNTNDGIAAAEGNYIAFYHADDLYDPEIVAAEVDYLERHPAAGAVFCKDILIDPEGREVLRVELPEEVRGEGLLDFPVVLNALLSHKNMFLRCPSCMIPASVYRDVGVFDDAEFKNNSDLELWLRIAGSYPIGILDRHLFRYRVGHGNSSGRYHHLRTDPERYFKIMDLYLGRGGGQVAKPASLDAYEAHRAEDRIMRAVSFYIQDQRQPARALLARVAPGTILKSARIQRGRMLALYLLMLCLVRLPRIGIAADAFYRRWHAPRGAG